MSPRRLRPAAAAVVFAVVAAFAGAGLLALAGCGSTSGTLAPNRPPETVVFVGGELDTVRHTVRLSWFGTDPDGEVDRYEFKWIYEPGQAPAGWDSSAWFSTTRVESTFVVWTPSGVSMPTFVVRAIDDENEPDPTPARQEFRFRNLPPTIDFTGTPVLPATTFPVATVRWLATDPDGDVSRAGTLLWLDGNSASPTFVPAGVTEYTIPPAAFGDGAGGWVTGPHTVHVRAVDDGGSLSAPDSFTWNVVAPRGEVLLVDDVTVGTIPDALYRNALNRQLGDPSAYSVIDLAANNPFRSPADVTATFGFFRSVVWYQENNLVRSGALALAEPAIRAQLAAGRNVYLGSTIAVGTAGALASPDFLDEIVGADSVRFNPLVGSTAFSIGNGVVMQARAPYDSMGSTGISSNVDALALRNAADAAFIAPIVIDTAGTVAHWEVGVDRVPDGGTGRFVLVTFPMFFFRGVPPGSPAPAPDANYAEKNIRRVLARFGHGTNP